MFVNVVILLIALAYGSDFINDRPIIGVLTGLDQQFVMYPDMSYLAESYVQWTEMGGARVVPVQVNRPYQELELLLGRLNGFLLPGGDDDLIKEDGSYTFTMNTACSLIKYIQKLNDEGLYYPIWATCQGFEILTLCMADDPDILLNFAGDNPSHMSTHMFTSQLSDSKMFNNDILYSKEIPSFFEKEAIALQAHHNGFEPSAFETNSGLKETFNVLATSLDKEGQEFVSIIEAKEYPFYGTQFHPEKNQFEWQQKQYTHSLNGIIANSYLSWFFVNETKRNHIGSTFEIYLRPYLIDNHDSEFADKIFEKIYLFDSAKKFGR